MELRLSEMNIGRHTINGIDIISLENDLLRVTVAPAAGGKITGIFNKELRREFLWTNAKIPFILPATGADYDSNFFGGMDELLPNDIPETTDGIAYPDHGELWTSALTTISNNDRLSLSGTLPKSGLSYKKALRLSADSPVLYLDYIIRNESTSARKFLWKLHAALSITAGDRILTTARKGRVADSGYSRFNDLEEFSWPMVEGTDASIIPEKTDLVDFFYLYGSKVSEMSLLSAGNGSLFSLTYDSAVFPYQWYFASYGGFMDHYTAILEPCSSMPISLNEAASLGQCSLLEPGEQLSTTVAIYAGKVK